MHTSHEDTRDETAPETAGHTLHQAGQYDVFTRLAGLGVNGSNSRMVVEMAQIKPGERVLDVGCGTGNLTLTARNYAGPAGSAVGIDPSPEMIAQARKNATRTGLEAAFELGLIEKIPYPDASFDVVINRLMIHHLPDDLKRQGLAEILRVLKPGGRLFIADFRASSHTLAGHLALVFTHSRMMQTDVADLTQMVKQAGFTEVASGPTRSAFLAFVSGKRPAHT